jgi:hypothetical protein
VPSPVVRCSFEPPRENEKALRHDPVRDFLVRTDVVVEFEITSGELFRVYVDGEMKLTRMEFRHFERDNEDFDDGDRSRANGIAVYTY